MIQTIDATKLYNEAIKTQSEKYLCMVEVKVNFKWQFVGYYHVNPTEYTIKKVKDKIYLMPNRYHRFLLNDDCIEVLQLGYLRNNDNNHNVKFDLKN